MTSIIRFELACPGERRSMLRHPVGFIIFHASEAGSHRSATLKEMQYRSRRRIP